MPTLLEVAVVQPRDVPGAAEGGADRLLLSGPDGLSVPPQTLGAVLRESDLPVRVVLRLSDSRTTTGGEYKRLIGLAEQYAELGAEGVAFGFLDPDLEVDVPTCTALAEALSGLPWTFTDAIDETLDPRRSWRRVAALPGVDAVCSAGSPRGLAAGYDDLIAYAEAEPAVAALLLPGAGLTAEMVPWFVQAGVTGIHLGPQVRPGGSAKAYVDAALVRSWRLLVDS